MLCAHSLVQHLYLARLLKYCCDARAGAASAQSFALWQLATTELTRRTLLLLVCVTKHIL